VATHSSARPPPRFPFTRKCKKTKKIQMYKKNLAIHEEAKILVDEKYNISMQAVHPLYIGSKRKPTKSKCRKNKNNPVICEGVQILDAEK
jgi:hypothetical protein